MIFLLWFQSFLNIYTPLKQFLSIPWFSVVLVQGETQNDTGIGSINNKGYNSVP